jgi:hypothetical protein
VRWWRRASAVGRLATPVSRLAAPHDQDNFPEVVASEAPGCDNFPEVVAIKEEPAGID